MVFNRENYPNMVHLFDKLGVKKEDTNMSFSVSLDGGKMEWGSSGLSALFAVKSNIVSPSFHNMLRDMNRFNREAPLLLTLDEDDPRRAVSLREYLKLNRYGGAFTRYYLVPMAAALWSSSSADVLAFSAITLISFFHNHQMLQAFGRPQWMTPAERSTAYVQAILKSLGNRLELGNACSSVSKPAVASAAEAAGVGGGGGVKEEGAWEVTDSRGVARKFDNVIFACPPDTTLSLLGDHASSDEQDALGSFEFADNTIYVHRQGPGLGHDRLMPVRKAAWSSWNYMGTTVDLKNPSKKKPVYVTYWLNKLQNLSLKTQVFVSLNPTTEPLPSLIHHRMVYRHPQFTPRSESGQRKLRVPQGGGAGRVNGKRGLWFAGAWLGYGFHEDGLRAGLEAATAISGKPVPWAQGNGAGQVGNGKALLESRGSGGKLVLPQPQVPVRQGLGYPLTALVGWMISGAATWSVIGFLRRTVSKGSLTILCPNNKVCTFGTPVNSGEDGYNMKIRVFDWKFFVRVATAYDLGLARSYMAGEWEIIDENPEHDGLRALFLFLIDNSRGTAGSRSTGTMKVGRLLTSWVGYALNFVRLRLSMDNSISGSRSNIEAHYDLSNDLFQTFLDTNLMLYSCGIFEAQMQSPGALSTLPLVPGVPPELSMEGSLEEAQQRKADTLIHKARVQKHHLLLDIGFGWGGISIRAAETVGCKVHGITLSKEQKALAEQKVRERGLEHLVTFELVDYRVFARKRKGEFDRIISCEMIEGVGHNYLGSYFASCDALLAPGGVMVMQAITTPESRYKEYLGSADFINTVIFPAGSCCPSLTALLMAMADNSDLSLEGYENICNHYAHTLREWRLRFNQNADKIISQGFDSAFIRCFNYYFTYCEAGFISRTEVCCILTFSRPGNNALLPTAETPHVTR
ncbi:unnamed protein product [Discosporangium mesarthrocarpum]